MHELLLPHCKDYKDKHSKRGVGQQTCSCANRCAQAGQARVSYPTQLLCSVPHLSSPSMAEVVTTLNTSTSNLRLSPTMEAKEETAFPGGEGACGQQKGEVGGPRVARMEELVVPGGAGRGELVPEGASRPGRGSKRELGLPGPGPGSFRRKSNGGCGGALNTQPRRFSEHRLKVGDAVRAVQCSAVQCSTFH